MRAPTVVLPPAAQAKLTELTLARDSAIDQMRSSQGRLSTLPPFAEQIRDRLAADRDRHAERHRVLALLVSRLNQWHMELRVPPGSVLESAPANDLKLKASETPTAAIAAVRKEIGRVLGEIATTRSLPMRRASQLEAMRAYLSRLAARSWPKVTFDAKGNATVQWAEDLATMEGVLGALTFVLGADQVSAAFALNLEPERADAVSPLEREKRLAELAAALLALERREESLIERAAGEGTEVLRRPDASPLAVLELAIIAAAAPASAA
jgi:hypothetical protein